MIRSAPFVLSSEAIYDQYGFRHPGFDPDAITWNRSIYYRDEHNADERPIQGVGYYVNLDYVQDAWTMTLNYGEFYPQYIGVAQHDRTQRRGIVKAAYNFGRALQVYSVVMLENGGYTAQDNFPRQGLVLLDGLQYTF